MARILIAEDCLDHQNLISLALGPNHETKFLCHAEGILEETKNFQPSMVILDVNMPGISGLDACSRLQSDEITSSIPVLFLTANRETNEVLKAFSLGADDYITKPFEPMILRARVEAKLKRAVRSPIEATFIQRGPLRLDLVAHRASIVSAEDEKPLSLTELEFMILALLVKHEGKVLSRQEILEKVWREQASSVTIRTVDTHLSSLRKKSRYIQVSVESVYGMGYRFVSGENASIEETSRRKSR